jgi:hypothetical protein
VGVVTVPERTEYLHQVMHGIEEHLRYRVADVRTYWDEAHRGPVFGKNELLKRGLASGAEWIFISEDDVVVQDGQAVYGYIRAAEESGWGHLAFAHHGPANEGGPVEKNEWVSIYPHYVGAWCLYSRRALQVCGLMDEHFIGSWDHVEHTLRLSLAGFHPMPEADFQLRAADATGSEHWLAEIPGSIENTALPHTEQWRADRERGRAYWRAHKPETYRLVFAR